MIKEILMVVLTVSLMYSFGMVSVITVSADGTYDQSNQIIDMYISHSATPTDRGARTIAQVVLSTYNIPLNAFELELTFDPSQGSVVDVVMHPELCEPRFLIQKQVNHDTGQIYVVCGSSTPFITGSQFMPVVTVELESDTGVLPQVAFAQRTNFHIHDGFGTAAATRLVQQTDNPTTDV